MLTAVSIINEFNSSVERVTDLTVHLTQLLTDSPDQTEGRAGLDPPSLTHMLGKVTDDLTE